MGVARLALAVFAALATLAGGCRSPPAEADPAAPARACEAEAAASPLAFQKKLLDPTFRGEAVTAIDVDGDGRLDFATDQFVYIAPDFSPHEIRTPETFDPASTYSADMTIFAVDVDGDGRTDLVVTPISPKPSGWYENPGRLDAHWAYHPISASTEVEHPIMPSLFGDARRQLVLGLEPDQRLAWLEPDVDRRAPWKIHFISPPRFAGVGYFVHGLGAGDLDGDGRMDILTGYGWFAGPPPDRRDELWTFHPYELCPNDCSEMLVWDVNGDGRPDVVSSSPHDYGVWWWEQGAGSGGAPTWTKHVIDASISETHAIRLDDLDGDGVPEIIVGKRWFSRFGDGPGGREPAEIAAYARGGSGADITWQRRVIDCDSGVGVRFDVKDFDGDGRVDIVAINKKGLFLFRR